MTKKLFIFFVFLLCFSPITQAEKLQLWFVDGADASYYINTERLDIIKENLNHPDPLISKRTDINSKRVWIDIVAAKPDEKNHDLMYSEILFEFDFTTNSFRVIYQAAYNKEDVLLADSPSPNNPWVPINPDDKIGELAQFLKNYLK